MSVNNIIELLPNSVKLDIIDFTTVKLKSGKIAERITIDRLLTETEKETLRKNKNILGVDSVAIHKHAPEIRRSYFYIVD